MAQEWRHNYGMRCLGIPNSKHFHDITSIEDAQVRDALCARGLGTSTRGWGRGGVLVLMRNNSSFHWMSTQGLYAKLRSVIEAESCVCCWLRLCAWGCAGGVVRRVRCVLAFERVARARVFVCVGLYVCVRVRCVHHVLLCTRARGSYDAAVHEEFEDAEGNVMTRKTYEDLARQGLLG